MSSNVDRMRESFEAQFEESGNGRYLYRRNQKGEPIPVSATERDLFVSQYVRRIWCLLVGMMVALLLAWGGIIWWTLQSKRALPETALYVATGLIAVVAIVLMYWVRGAPARQLEGRTPVGRERTSEEMRAMFFQKTTYGSLAAVAGMGVFLPVMVGFGRYPIDVFHGWGRLWLVFGGALVLLAAVQSFRKWRFESEHPSDTI